MSLFHDRKEAGQRLAEELPEQLRGENIIVLGLPRGGVPVAFEVAKRLQAPLDVFVVRKLGAPGQQELAVGAIASGGVRVFNEQVLQNLNLSHEMIDQIETREREELQRRESLYRGDRPALEIAGRTAVLIDDGLATGASMLAAVKALRELSPDRIVVAVPTAPPQTCEKLSEEVDEIICAETPQPFTAIGAWYENFPQTTDEEVRKLLSQATQ